MNAKSAISGNLPHIVPTRRTLISASALAAFALTGAGVLPALAEDGNGDGKVKLTDEQILNFALNLEYLEAEFYLRAVTGMGLADADISGQGNAGGVSGGRQVNFETDSIRGFAREIAMDETAHVRFLRAGLGSAAVARPQINLDTAFTTAARAAGLIGMDATFDPYANENNFLLAAFIFEDVGVTAYKGAARFIENKDFLEAAAGILAVEAYHAGEIRTTLHNRGLWDPAGKISDARDSLDGSDDLDQGIRMDNDPNIVPTDENGIAFGRTPEQVLNIVYLGGDASNFGFFPNRVNGSIA